MEITPGLGTSLIQLSKPFYHPQIVYNRLYFTRSDSSIKKPRNRNLLQRQGTHYLTIEST